MRGGRSPQGRGGQERSRQNASPRNAPEDRAAARDGPAPYAAKPALHAAEGFSRLDSSAQLDEGGRGELLDPFEVRPVSVQSLLARPGTIS